jgi:hypothetical protein
MFSGPVHLGYIMASENQSDIAVQAIVLNDV